MAGLTLSPAEQQVVETLFETRTAPQHDGIRRSLFESTPSVVGTFTHRVADDGYTPKVWRGVQKDAAAAPATSRQPAQQIQPAPPALPEPPPSPALQSYTPEQSPEAPQPSQGDQGTQMQTPPKKTTARASVPVRVSRPEDPQR